MVVVVLAVGCGNGSGGAHDAAPRGTSDAAAPVIDGAPPVDASEPVFDAGLDGGVAGACNPITQQGCDAGEKCSWLVVQEDPFLGRTDCVPDGTVAVGGACTEGPPGETTGYDDCAAGSLCIAGMCKTICSIEPDSLEEAALVVEEADARLAAVGRCRPIGICARHQRALAVAVRIDPIGIDRRAEGGAVARHAATGPQEAAVPRSAAVEVAAQAVIGAPVALRQVLGAGRRGSAGRLAVEQRQVAALGVDRAVLGDRVTQRVADARVPDRVVAEGLRVESSFVDMNGSYLDYVSDAYGLCTPRNATFGNCNTYSEEWFLEQYNLFIEGGGDPSGWGDEITALCDARTGGCPYGCAKVATFDALDAAYCAVPANAGRPACSAGLRGARIVRRSLEWFWAERLIRAAAAVR
jgi:hypothetical protein